MSDNSQVVVRLDVPGGDEQEPIVASVRNWLLSTEVIAPFAPKPTWREEFGRTDFSPGPRWRDAVDEVHGAVFETLWHNGVDLRASVDYCSAMANTEPWNCGSCGAEFEDQDLLGDWVDTHVEPTVRCTTCGWSAPLGDWPCKFPAVLVGAPIVEFHNWHPLRPDFVSELTRRVGGDRCRYFWSHL